jgi:hypothetical protein
MSLRVVRATVLSSTPSQNTWNSSVSTRTVSSCPAHAVPTRNFWPATVTVPTLCTRRVTSTGPSRPSGSGFAGRASGSRAGSSPVGAGMVLTSSPSWATCSRLADTRTTTSPPASRRPTLTVLAPRRMVPLACTRRRTSTAGPTTGALGAPPFAATGRLATATETAGAAGTAAGLPAAGGLATAATSATGVAGTAGGRPKRSAGVRMPSAWCGRRVLYSTTQASTAACASATSANIRPASSSARTVLWNRSILPVVVGERTPVNRWVMPRSRHSRSNNTTPGGRPNRPVNTLPLSLSSSSGSPWRSRACRNTRHTACAVARCTTPAATQNLEWSSRPVTSLASCPSASCTPPITSICHSCIGRSRSQRR